MTEAGTDWAGLRNLAVEVAGEAAELVATRRRAGVDVVATKSSSVDLVTATDQESEQLLRRLLAAARPDDGFVGEEGGASASATGVTWVVDPIDGTVNFVYGIPHYAVSVAAQLHDQVVAAAVVDVAHGEVFAAARDQGATSDGRALRVRPTPPVSEALVVTGFGYVREVRERQAAAIARLLPQVRDVRRTGSCALDLCWLGAGRADAYVEEGPAIWDHAAGGLVASEAGARVEVHPGPTGRDCIVAAGSDGFEEFLELVRGAGFLRDAAKEYPVPPHG